MSYLEFVFLFCVCRCTLSRIWEQISSLCWSVLSWQWLLPWNVTWNFFPYVTLSFKNLVLIYDENRNQVTLPFFKFWLSFSLFSFFIFPTSDFLACSHSELTSEIMNPVGRTLGQGIDPSSQSLYLHRITEHKKTRTSIRDSSGIRTHDSSARPV